ncbi:MAG: amidohydrolase family protein, partial [Kiritimatiellae bacterium]|nr:amidohydrolase family protein [Kiritimatiellia bacterium]
MNLSCRYPGFVDVHVHFRDPGLHDAETTASGLAAAARGGFAAVVTMPNTNPATDSPDAMDYQRRAAAASAGGVLLLPSACITKGRLGREVADLEALAEAGAAFFTDDGSYVADDHVMEEAMRRSARLGMSVCQHAMDPREQRDGVIRDCPLARRLHLPVIPPSAETAAIRRDLSICRVTGCRLHVQHISTAEGVELVRGAQKEGLPVTAEATPHHLLLSSGQIPRDDANYKMAPPLGNDEDRAELRRAVRDGILMFATDHAPHPAAAKARGFAGSANGIIGLETAVAITWAVMVEE